ncbi:hypothetical protein EC835_101768 [Providencia alcalifaciens]|uniref:Uncharacterized protein n=1 Tax=Providencia alcalifaciens TaxID=126385 RepID=A0A4R3NSF3_9GAMM|nr:hypothetical protein [Providencia alcalifaciens]MBC5790217.1 hypothetical protein [Providencia sp. JUb39]TCT38744.1 hypothetical protein EC835_101768 [Providencia alcalifaciens]
MIEQDNTEHEINEYDSPILKAVHHVDDGCDWTARIIHGIRQRCYIRMGICPPLSPAPKIAAPKLIPITKKKKRARKVKDDNA